MRLLSFILCCVLFSALSVSAEPVKKDSGPPTKKQMQEAEKAAAEAAKNHKLTMADCNTIPTWSEDYDWCVWDMAMQEKSIHFCVYLDFPTECLQNVMKLTKVTAADCKQMTRHENVCLELVKQSLLTKVGTVSQ